MTTRLLEDHAGAPGPVDVHRDEQEVVIERRTAVTMSAIRPISVVAPVWVTTIVAVPS